MNDRVDARFVVVTGMSGAGKGQALRFLEDLGYYCVDNLPVQLMETFSELLFRENSPYKRIAICVDARTGDELRNLPAYIEAVAERGARPSILFLESSDRTLLQRYSESRRRHPAAPDASVEEGIQLEREMLGPIRARADLVVDTSSTSVADLRERIAAMFAGGAGAAGMSVTVMSFGFKFGPPPEADLVFDVRFLPNPHYVEALRPFTGNEADVRDFVLNNDDAREFMDRLKGLLAFLLPRYAAEPKAYLTIAVGCTGGRHRSVAVAHEISAYLRGLEHNVRLRHRDVSRPV